MWPVLFIVVPVAQFPRRLFFDLFRAFETVCIAGYLAPIVLFLRLEVDLANLAAGSKSGARYTKRLFTVRRHRCCPSIFVQ